jgi:hypothetical protein
MHVRFDFDRNLDDPTFEWMVEGAQGFRRFRLPPRGIGVRLSP